MCNYIIKSLLHYTSGAEFRSCFKCYSNHKSYLYDNGTIMQTGTTCNEISCYMNDYHKRLSLQVTFYRKC